MIFEQLRGLADVVIVDGPALSAPEGLALTAAVGEVVLCIGTHNARRSLLVETIEAATAAGATVLGAVIVDVEHRLRDERSDYAAPRDLAPVTPAPHRTDPKHTAEALDDADGTDSSDTADASDADDTDYAADTAEADDWVHPHYRSSPRVQLLPERAILIGGDAEGVSMSELAELPYLLVTDHADHTDNSDHTESSDESDRSEPSDHSPTSSSASVADDPRDSSDSSAARVP